MAATLHQLMSADPRTVAECLAFARPGDTILLVDRGVDLLSHWERPDTAPLRSPGLEILALEADASAAGLLTLAGRLGMSLLPDAQWVDQVCRSARVLSWK
jgi:sulfur transfer complex TusBCD TusB component (DsrH family)